MAGFLAAICYVLCQFCEAKSDTIKAPDVWVPLYFREEREHGLWVGVQLAIFS